MALAWSRPRLGLGTALGRVEITLAEAPFAGLEAAPACKCGPPRQAAGCILDEHNGLHGNFFPAQGVETGGGYGRICSRE
jgi:hypothetical protein